MSKNVNDNVHHLSSNLRYAAEDIDSSIDFAKKLKDKELITKLEGIKTSIGSAQEHVKAKTNSKEG
jgi:hypothetical protein